MVASTDVKCTLESLFTRRYPTNNLLRRANRKYKDYIKGFAKRLGLPPKQIVYHMFVSDHAPLCPVCGKLAGFKTLNRGYDTYCSFACSVSPQALVQRAKRAKQTFQKKYGADHHMMTKPSKQKFENTMIERYGVAHALESSSIMKRLRENNRGKWGVDYPLQDPSVIQRRELTNIGRYGVKNVIQNAEIQGRLTRTNMKRFGCKHALENETVQHRKKVTMLERYGVENSMQVRSIHERQQLAGFTTRRFRIGGKVFYTRGYEDIVIRWLVNRKGCDPLKVINCAKDGLTSIPWTDANGKHRVYHPDMYVKYRGRWYMVEVKGLYTLGISRSKGGAKLFDQTKLKAQACIDAGYRFRLVLVHHGKRINVINGIEDKSRLGVIRELESRHPELSFLPLRKHRASRTKPHGLQ